MLMMKAGVFRPTSSSACARSSAAIPSIAADADGLRIGALTPLAAVERSADVAASRRSSCAPCDAVQCAGAQRRHHRRQSRPWRSAYGSAAGADGARCDHRRSSGRAGERTLEVEDLFAGYYETVLRGRAHHRGARARRKARRARLYESHHRLGRRLAGARRRRVIEGDGEAIRSAQPRRQRRDREGDPPRSRPKPCSPAPRTDDLLRQAGDAAAADAEFIADMPRLGALQARTAAGLCAPRGARGARWRVERTDGRTAQSRRGKAGSQVGRSLPRLEGRDKVTGRAEYTHLCGCRACCMARCSAPRWRTAASSRSTPARRSDVPGVSTSSPSRTSSKVIPDPYYGPAFHDQPILAVGKVHYRRRAGRRRAGARPACGRGRRLQLIIAEYEELPAVFDEVEAAHHEARSCMSELKPAGTFADLKHLKGVKDTNVALDYRLRRGDFDKAYAAAEHMFEHEFSTQKVLHLSFEPFATIADFETTASRSIPRRRARPSCAPRSRGCSAGRRTTCASRCPTSAAAMAPSSTSSSRRWRSRSP